MIYGESYRMRAHRACVDTRRKSLRPPAPDPSRAEEASRYNTRTVRLRGPRARGEGFRPRLAYRRPHAHGRAAGVVVLTAAESPEQLFARAAHLQIITRSCGRPPGRAFLGGRPYELHRHQRRTYSFFRSFPVRQASSSKPCCLSRLVKMGRKRSGSNAQSSWRMSARISPCTWIF